MPAELNIMIGGEAGQGLQSAGFLLSKAFNRGGYYVFADQDYESRVRGGRSFFRIRVSDAPVATAVEVLDILLALNRESIELHQREAAGRGVVVYDSERTGDISATDRFFGVPLTRLAKEEAGNKVMANTVALGVALGLVGYGLDILNKLLLERFGSGDKGEANIKAAAAGYRYAEENYEGAFSQRIIPLGGDKKMLLNGNEALALGAIAAGCRFMSAYPMTPATSIMEYLGAKAEELGLVVLQVEDEIAALNMAIGAGYAGVRAMTATSGSGFCLMVEGLGMAGITETPVVVVDGQRPGPCVGLPTRTEQGDLEFVIHAHHGDFPRAVLAPATQQECFWAVVKAFNLAEKYQIPVIILTDHHLASSFTTTEEFDLSKVIIERGLLYNKGQVKEEYKRHRITENGISPRAFPGQEGVLVMTDTDEHDEAGHLIEDAATRTKMVDKRQRKLLGLASEIATPQLYGEADAATMLLGWGSTRGAIYEAVDILNGEGISANALHFSEIWPFSFGMKKALDGAYRTFAVENNATGQLAHLIRAETGREVDGKVLKYDGRPFSPAYIVDALRKELG